MLYTLRYLYWLNRLEAIYLLGRPDSCCMVATRIAENDEHKIMKRAVDKVKFSKIAHLAACLIFGLVGNVNAGIIPVSEGYEVSYQFNMTGIPRNGADIQDTFIFEWDEDGKLYVDYGYTIAGRGETNISRKLSFEPTAALIMGYGLGGPDEKDHIFTFVDPDFAVNVAGLKWSEVFPGVPPKPRIRHNELVSLIIDSANTNPDADVFAKLTNFVKYEAYVAAFDPSGRFRVVEWSVAFIPEPATLALFGLGIAGIGYRRKNKKAA